MDPLCKVDPDFIVLEEKAKHKVLQIEGVTLIILESYVIFLHKNICDPLFVLYL